MNFAIFSPSLYLAIIVISYLCSFLCGFPVFRDLFVRCFSLCVTLRSYLAGCFPYRASMRSGRPMLRNVLSICGRCSGLYQKKNCRWSSFSCGVFAENTFSMVYGSYPVYHVSVATVIGVGVKSCTCSRWKSSPFVTTASSAMSSARHPG